MSSSSRYPPGTVISLNISQGQDHGNGHGQGQGYSYCHVQVQDRVHGQLSGSGPCH